MSRNRPRGRFRPLSLNRSNRMSFDQTGRSNENGINHNNQMESPGNTSRHRGGFRNGLGPRSDRSSSVNPSHHRPRNEPRNFPMGYKALSEILNKEPDDIILELLRENSGYKLLLADAEIKPDKITLIFKVLSKSCDTICNRENLLDLLSQSFCHTFKNILLSFIISIKELPTDSMVVKGFFSNLFEVCFLYQESRPFESISSLEGIVKATQLVLVNDNNFEGELKLCNELKDKVEETKNYFIEKADGEKKKKSFGKFWDQNMEDEMEPPDDFRKISVLPTKADIIDKDRPFLRKNVIDGQYQDANHYLDIQFRLLREDFIRPLREGISQFRGYHKNQSLNRDLKMYKRVKVEKSELVKGQFVYYIKLNMDRELTLENSKRLLFGNLLCFSKDNFQTMYFGYVCDRSIELIKKGLIGVKFESKPIDFTGNYDMAESKAYFIAYQHVLKALQEIKKEDLSLPHYLLYVSSDLHHPGYMSNTTCYDLRFVKDFKLMKRQSPSSFMPRLGKPEPVAPDIYKHPNISRVIVTEPIDSWPSKEQLSLDDSQRAALYGALTRQLAIIQGPPGTGKTFLGLKITQILLHNSDRWNNGEGNPILVVCYTNHALDQFLEGMISFTENIVRIGSRSKSEVMSQFQIKEWSHAAKRERVLPRNIHEHNSTLNNEVRTLENTVSTLIAEIQEFRNPKGIFSYFSMRHVIPKEIAVVLQKIGMENWLLGDIAMETGSSLQGLTSNVSNISPSTDGLENSTGNLTLDKEEVEVDDKELWEDAKEFVEQEEMNRMIDLDSNLSVGDSKFKPNTEHLYDSTLRNITYEIENLGQYVTDKNYQYDMELSYKYNYLLNKRKMLELYLNKLKEIDSSIKFNSKKVVDARALLRTSIPERWKLYNSWIEMCIHELNKRISVDMTAFQRKSKALVEMRNQEYLFIMRNSSVVGMTTTGAAQFSKVIQALGPKIVIIEEAAEILESHVVVSLSSKCEHLILIGDHQQLRPSTTVYELAVKYNLETSLFERMIKNGVRFGTLQYQHRMRPAISKLLVPNIYPSLLDDKSVHGRAHIMGMTKDIYFIDHQFFEEQHFDDNNSRENLHEASLIIALCRHLLLQGYPAEKITILTPYSGQFFLLRKLQREEPICISVKICVVDNFQGEENDIILLSLVRGNAEGNVGFLKIENRVCVALSRAKNGFYIVGNMTQLCMKSELWKKINQSLAEQDCVGPSLTLRCNNHPHVLTVVTNARQFLQKSPEGGCSLPCSFNFKLCGHPCPRTCHAMDMEHLLMKCMKVCLKKLCANDDHLCTKRCWEDCGPCQQLVLKKLPCGHSHEIACYIDPAKVSCQIKVERELPDCQHVNKIPCYKKVDKWICFHMCDTRVDCGHQCRDKCHRKKDPLHKEYQCLQKCALPNKGCSLNHKCHKLCYEDCGLCIRLVVKRFPCGHTHNNVKCHEKPEDIPCLKVCGKIMPCGHYCKMNCNETCGGCKVIVEKKIPECFHMAKVPCGTAPSKIYCKGNCVLRLACGHRCKVKCKDPCTSQCKELVPTMYKCPQNHSIKVPCYLSNTVNEEDAWMFCNDDCNRILTCNHACKGKCGDCFSGRVHMPCQEKCEKTLVCGHICRSPCSMDCPPCQNNCEFKCEHSRCRNKCAIPCIPCQERCKWRCIHKKCGKKCGDLCSREPCTEPCEKFLSCDHPCIGFCGDPCPPLCRICDHEKLTEVILSGSEGEADARYVMLQDCKHVIEVSALEQWLSIDSGEIGIKKCPKCSKGIYNCRRYNHLLKKFNEDVNRVKKKYFDHNVSSKIQKEIKELDASHKGTINKFYNTEYDTLMRAVGLNVFQTNKKKKKHFSSMEYNLVLFKAKALKKASNILLNVEENFSSPELRVYCTKVHEHLKLLVRKVLNIQDRVSSQMSEDITSEMRRIEYLMPIFKLRNRKTQNARVALISPQIDSLMDPSIKFDTALEEKVKALLKESERYIGGLGISESERLQILKAMGLSQCHWYKCPNNHIYCIGDCGGARQTSTCPECGAAIGGSSHNLLSDNSMGPSLALKCNNHPHIMTVVTNAKQFLQKCPEGGCLLPCSFNFKLCGHPCPRTCHAMDMEHLLMKCMKVCLKKLCANDDHLCKKRCWEDCGPCQRLVPKKLPCGHSYKIACNIDPAKVSCQIKVERELPDCQHVNKMPCFEKVDKWICSHMCDTIVDCGHQCRDKCHRKKDPLHKEYQCLQKCALLNKSCSLNHKCIRRCYEDCGLCLSLVEKRFPCGHTNNYVKCHEKPEDILCVKVCGKIMPCGHYCKGKCNKPCGGCEEIMDKKIPECFHMAKVPCGTAPSKIYCKGNCVLRLACGHRCKVKCKDPCTSQCKELVPTMYKCPQNHSIKVPCYLSNTVNEEDAWMFCNDDCNSILTCNHACKGKCGDCFSGRVHMPCQQKCEKTLVCGHICRSPCSMDCPPCQNNCEFKCEHSRCRNKCAIPCRPCHERCKWRCIHKKCGKKCGDLCSREPCTEPCEKFLSCDHPCIGFCGDPCPPLCRICDHEKLTEVILSGSEGEADARYVMLQDCNHVIEVSALEHWLCIDSGEIGIKQCPTCKKGIYNCRRYNNLLKKFTEDVNRVKKKYFDHNVSSKIQKEIKELDASHKGTINKFYNTEYDTLMKAVGLNVFQTNKKKKKHFTSMEYNLVLFKAKALQKASNIFSNVEENFSSPELCVYCTKVREHLKLLVKKVLNIQDRVSSQMSEDITSEMRRIEYLMPIFKLRSRKTQNARVALISPQIDSLMDPSIKFDTVLEEKVKALLKESERDIGGLGISESERLQFLKAMSLSQGHWYKCPNNHTCCITECGGAMQTATCPECGAAIRGSCRSKQALLPMINFSSS